MLKIFSCCPSVICLTASLTSCENLIYLVFICWSLWIMENAIISLLRLHAGKYIFTLRQLQKTNLFKIFSEQRCDVDFKVYFIGRCTLICIPKYYLFGRLHGDHRCAVCICISTVQYIGIQCIFSSHDVLSSADSRQFLRQHLEDKRQQLSCEQVGWGTPLSTDKGH